MTTTTGRCDNPALAEDGDAPSLAAMPLRLFDIGANLGHDSLRPHLADVLQRAAKAGVRELMVTGTSVQSSRQALHLCQSNWEAETGVALLCTAGIHPHDSGEAVKHGLGASLHELELLIGAEPKLVRAVGECGLDFDRNFSTPADQEAAFVAHIQLAVHTGLPLFLHERSAHKRLVELLEPHAPQLRGVLHCFTGTLEEMQRYLSLGLYIGITGWVCDERRGQDLQAAILHLPLDRLLLETDAPFLIPRNIPKQALTPEQRKRRNNEPSFLPYVALKVAELQGKPIEAVVEAATLNSRRLFSHDNF
eukprot:SM000034S12793  [mRNA]  locus=s34:901409:902836:+ [translate_table: standard]